MERRLIVLILTAIMSPAIADGQTLLSKDIIDETNDFICLSKAIYFEARSEPIRAQIAVAQVVMQRVESSNYPATVCAVVQQPRQFSFTHDGRSETPRNRLAWRRAKAIARIVYNGYRIPELEGALNYHATYARRREWMAELIPVATYGQHVFYIHGPGK